MQIKLNTAARARWHMAEVLLGVQMDAAQAASIFRFGEFSVADVKRYMAERSTPLRL